MVFLYNMDIIVSTKRKVQAYQEEVTTTSVLHSIHNQRNKLEIINRFKGK